MAFDSVHALQRAIELVKQANKQSEELDGKRYTTVADRVACFRETFGPMAAIKTTIEVANDDVVQARAEVYVPFELSEGTHLICVATGHAEEWRNAHEINRTSALENAETSAVGRALANLGLHGGEYATLEEVLSARLEEESARANAQLTNVDPAALAAALEELKQAGGVDDLEAAWIPLPRPLKLVLKQLYDSKLAEISAQQSGSASERDGSPQAPSEPPAASRQRQGKKSGGA